jgi:hypothetical protein
MTWVLALLAGAATVWAQNTGDGHQLTSLWKEYNKAYSADRPQKEAEALSKIKAEAMAQHLPVDFYDAATQYVRSVQRRDWKQQDTLRRALAAEVKAFDEPIVTFLWMQEWDGASHAELLAYLNAHPDGFKGCNQPLHRNLYYLNDGFRHFIRSDREYALWYLREFETLKAEVRYPGTAILAYTQLQKRTWKEDEQEQKRQAYEELADKYAGYVFSVYPRAALLQLRFEELEGMKPDSKAYRALYEDAKALEKERSSYVGEDRILVSGCNTPRSLAERLGRSEVWVRFDKDEALILFRNLAKATVTLREGDKTLDFWQAKNPKGSFYVVDTVRIQLPKLSDGSYTLEARNGKIQDTRSYEQHTLSIATCEDSRGRCVYVTDYETGVPLRSVTLKLQKGGKEVASASLKLDGFTPLPAALTKHLKSSKASWYLVAESGTRKSPPVYLGPAYEPTKYEDQLHCNIYKDRGAYTPGDTLQFKAIVFNGDPARSLQVVKGRKVKVRLRDDEGEVIESLQLKTNDWGSVSGKFVIPAGRRGGYWALEVEELGSDCFIVDEFVLPTFDLEFDAMDKLYLAGDDVTVSGKLVSYSGHSLAGARVHVKVEKVLDEDVPLEADAFKTVFHAGNTGYYEAEVTVTEATGETHNYRQGWFIGDRLRIDVKVKNKADAQLVAADQAISDNYVITSRILDLVLCAMNDGGHNAPLPLRYELTTPDGKVVLAGGETLSEKPLSLELPGDGTYLLNVSVSAEKKDGTRVTTDKTLRIICIQPGNRTLTTDAKRVFIAGDLKGKEITARIGSAEGDAWAIVTLYGENRQVLANQAVRVKDGTLEDIRLPYKNTYPDAVRLQVFYFIHGNAVEYEREYRRENDKYTLPLQFSRFVNKAYPGAQYSFTVKTAPGAEVLVAAWDKSMDAVMANGWQLVNARDFSVERVRVSSSCGHVGYDYYWNNYLEEVQVIAYGVGRRTKSLASANAVYDDYVMEEVFSIQAEAIPDPPTAPAPIREEFASALTFQPQLYPSADGTLDFSFRTSDKLSTYYVRVYAHDKAMHNAMVTDEMVVTLPVKVSLTQPRYLYAGDRYEAAVTVSSVADAPVSGVLSLMAGDKVQQVRVEVPAGGTVTEYFPVTCHSDYSSGHSELSSCHSERSEESIVLTASFKAADFSDAVRYTVPVYPAAQQLTEAHSAVLLPGMDREALLSDLRSRFVNVPASEASLREISVKEMVEAALPSHVEPAGNDVLSLSEAWYVAQLIHLESDLLEKILSCRNADGGFGWFEGMTSSPVITAVLLERFARLRDRGFEVPDMTAAVKYLDKNQFGAVRPVWNGWIGDAQYVYVRSMYSGVPFEEKAVTAAQKKRFSQFAKDVKRELVPSAREGRGLNGQVLGKARRLLTLRNLLERDGGLALAKAWGISLGTSARLKASIKADNASLLEYAVRHRDGGWYYPNAVMPWRGLLESEAYAHALLCELLNGTEVADGIRLWLMLQKETQKWEATPAFVDAITAIMDGSEAMLNTKVLALSASYEAPFSSLKATGNGFTIDRQFFRNGVEIHPGDTVSVGDRISVQYKIWNGENRSFVKLTAGREASLSPVQQLSGLVSLHGYRHVKASATEYYFDSYPEEKTTVTEEFFVVRAGTFVAPVVTIESLYAPHYRANSSYRPPLVSHIR